MRTTSERSASNVIEVSFNSDSANNAAEEFQNHLNSLVETAVEDPLASLLNEFEYQSDKDREEEKFNEFRLSYKQDLITMSETLMAQIRALNEKTARLSYYLTEMNFEG